MFCLLIFLYVSFAEIPGSPFLELSLVNATVEKNNFFEIQMKRFSPNLTHTSVNGLLFVSIECGYLLNAGQQVSLTSWIPPLRLMRPKNPLSLDYQNRVQIRRNTIMRILSADFKDEGRSFYCQLSMLNTTSLEMMVIEKNAKVETVYSKYINSSVFGSPHQSTFKILCTKY